MGGEDFELRELTIRSGVWIDVRVEDTNLTRSDCDSCRHRETWSPRTLLPREIKPGHVGHRQATQQGDARVAFVVQTDRFFKIEPPFTLDRFDAAWDPGRCVNPIHLQLRGKLTGDVMTTCANRAFVSFLQSKNVDGRK